MNQQFLIKRDFCRRREGIFLLCLSVEKIWGALRQEVVSLKQPVEGAQ